MNSLKEYFQCKNFGAVLSDPVSFKDGLELLFTHKPGDQFLYQVLNGKLRKIKRNHENRFVQTIASTMEDSEENLVYFSESQTFLNWAPETIKDGFYLGAKIQFERPITIGKAIDLMKSGKFVKLKNPKTNTIQCLSLLKFSGNYYWKNADGGDEPVSYGKLLLSELLDYEFFEIVKIDDQEEKI